MPKTGKTKNGMNSMIPLYQKSLRTKSAQNLHIYYFIKEEMQIFIMYIKPILKKRKKFLKKELKRRKKKINNKK